MITKLAINTDYSDDNENPEVYLKEISEAGFTHVHWCHEWNTDYIYSESEINEIISSLKKYNLEVLDLHASEGKKVNWISEDESLRAAGIELVKNRIYMANKLSCEAIVLHFKREPKNESVKQKYWDILHKSLNELKPYAQEHNIKIALENYKQEHSHEIEKLFLEYDSDFLGFCYDSGHGNIGDGLATLEKLKDRLIVIHLHDNDGETDQHKLIFSGTLDWDELAKILAESSYKKCINIEVEMKNSGILDKETFLSKAYATGMEFSELVENYRAPMLTITSSLSQSLQNQHTQL
jgi:sugar phosphate isomerase/epimerase